jgi:hypothetical protein
MKIVKYPTIKVFIHLMAVSLTKLAQETLKGIIASHLFPSEYITQAQIMLRYLCMKKLAGSTPNTH